MSFTELDAMSGKQKTKVQPDVVVSQSMAEQRDACFTKKLYVKETAVYLQDAET